jgi:hypothetical protein
MADPNRYERALISDALEHDDTAGPKVKRVGNYIYDTNTLEWKKWDGTANIDMATEGIATETTLAQVEANQHTNQTTSSEEALLLRRLVKIMESQANTDSSLRQRVVVENISGTTLGRSMTGLDSGAGVAAPNMVTAAAPFSAPNATYFQAVWVGPVDQRFQIMDQARNAYANGIRNNLSFS